MKWASSIRCRNRQPIARVRKPDLDVAGGEAVRHRVVGNVGEKRGIDADRAGEADRIVRGAGDDDVVRRVRNAVGTDTGDDLREARGVGNEVAVLVGAEQRNRADVLVGRRMPSILACSLTSPHVAMPPAPTPVPSGLRRALQ
jgi:hypothetical protein